jgi:ribose-phosphate pyrophosphokinase
METLLMISALRGSSAKRVTAVLPIFGYARQDKKDHQRACVTARLIADLLEVAGVDRAITIDLHASQIQGFFVKPIDNLQAEGLLCEAMHRAIITPAQRQGMDAIIVSPDAGGAKRASSVASRLGLSYAIISKMRSQANAVESMTLVGSVQDKLCIIVDDMADTCGTLVLAAETLIEHGAREVHAFVVHGVLSGPALERINKTKFLSSVVVTNTIPQDLNITKCSKLKVIDISRLLADAIRFVATDQSLTKNLVDVHRKLDSAAKAKL